MTRLPERERRRLWATLLPIVVLVVTACSSGGTASPSAASSAAPSAAESVAPSTAPSAEASATAAAQTADEIIASSGITADASFCGTKPMTLGIYDGGGINGWSAASYAAVRSEAAKCSNVTQDA